MPPEPSLQAAPAGNVTSAMAQIYDASVMSMVLNFCLPPLTQSGAAAAAAPYPLTYLPHVSGGPPPCMPQCSGASVGAIDSKELKTDAPNSDANWLVN